MAADRPRQDLKRQVERLEQRLAETREELAAIKDQQAAVAPGVINALGLDTPTGRRQALKYAGGAATLPALVAYAASEQAQADAVAADVGTQADPWQKVWTHEIESGDGATQLDIPDTVNATDIDITDQGDASTTELIEADGTNDAGGNLRTQHTDGVSTLATTILSFPGVGLTSAIVVVQGDEISDNSRFSDIVHWIRGTGTASLHSIDNNAPDNRTYTRSGDDLQLAMAANSYDVVATAMVTQRAFNATS